jgi:hypothetical protein
MLLAAVVIENIFGSVLDLPRFVKKSSFLNRRDQPYITFYLKRSNSLGMLS